jgi:SAM-dependent methyltransferase
LAAAPDTRQHLSRLVTGHILTQCLYCVAELRVVDEMPAGEPIGVDDLAARVGADADALHRVLRALAAEGLFVEVEPRAYQVTEVGELFRDSEGSLRYGALLHGGQTMRLFLNMIDTVRTGVPVPILLHGRSRWEELASDPEQSEVFNRAMRGRAAALVDTAGALDWDDTRTLVDVGGGIGGVLLPLLQQHEHLHGTLFDLPHVADDARRAVDAAGLGARCTVEGGSFFEEVPRGADVYLLSNVLHDWNDDDAAKILRNCRVAVRDDSRILVLESLVPPGNDRHPVKVLDLQMLVALGGRERTETEFAALLATTGFELTGVSGSGPFALEARPV